MVNVYEAVDSNKRRSWIIISIFIVFILTTSVFMSKALAAMYGYQSTGLELTGIALIFSGVMSFASYYFSDRIILTLSQAFPASPSTHRLLYAVTENLSLAAGLPMPKLYVIEDTAMNAFATGRDPQHAVVCITSGLLTRLSRTELEGVIAHELSHVANYDIRLMSIVTVLVGLVTLLADWFLRASWLGSRRSRDSRGAGGILLIIGLVLALLSPLIAQLIQLALSRRREYSADAAAVKLTRQPGGLISALSKLSQDKEPLEAANKATAHLYIVNPLKNLSGSVNLFAGLFHTHPPIADRIAALQAMS